MKFLRNLLLGHPIEPLFWGGKGFTHKGIEYIHHSDLPHSQTAFYRTTFFQKIFITFLAAITIYGLVTNTYSSVLFIVAMLSVLYFVDLLFNLFLICRSFSNSPEIKISEKELQELDKWSLPNYTVFCPLYKEWQVIPQFLKAMNAMDYPKEKLQVMLLLEEDDVKTIEYVNKLTLPSHFEVVIVSHSFPKTKPKALNYGLKKATGDFIVIYDAEDIPDRLQLKKVILGFRKAKENVVCIQAKLNFYNPHQNVLTKIFTAEYALWFDLVLTGLQSIHAPIPLGGTSNHFRTTDIKKLKGWDSFNVTEDADLGMRLVKMGYQTAIIDSDTHEEANSEMKNWFWQRSRWIKGYMQTYLVHMRRPQDFLKSWKEPHAVTFQLIIGGKVLSTIVNPIMWTITISYFVFRAAIGPTIESFYPAPILYVAIFSLIFGNFLYIYYYMIGCAKRQYYDIIKYAFLVPVYWLAMSFAAWTAIYLLIRKPHHWSKTTHGLHLQQVSDLPRLSSALLGQTIN